VTGKEEIRKALSKIMDDGDANACAIRKGWDYDGTNTEYGWFYTQFGENATYLGRTVPDALEMIDIIAEGRETE